MTFLLRMIIAVAVLAATSGCTTSTAVGSYADWALLSLSVASAPVPTAEQRSRLGAVAVAPARYAPDSYFVQFAEGPFAGAATGAGAGMLLGSLAAAGAFALHQATAIFAAPVAIMAITVNAATWAVMGGPAGGKSSREKATKKEIADAVARLDAQQALMRHLVPAVQQSPVPSLSPLPVAGPARPDQTPSYCEMKDARVDTVLEVAVSEIGFDGCGKGFFQNQCPGGSDEPLVYLFMVGKARLVRVADGAEIYSGQFRYDSPPRQFAQWAANDAQALAEELEQGYRHLADSISSELFLVTPVQLPVPSYWLLPGDPMYLVCWLHPVQPAVELTTPLEGIRETFSQTSFLTPGGLYPVSPLRFSAAESLEPTLKWSAFPREIDRAKLEPALLSGIDVVSYDLRIWKVDGASRGRLVYERTALPAPEHKVEQPLEPGQRYFWSFRARFMLKGQPMATRWAALRIGTCDRNLITQGSYYRFTTPQ